MNDLERDAILTIALMAAFADGNNDNRERDEVRRITEAMGSEAGINTAAIYQNVLLKKISLTDAASRLQSSESKMLAYEFAVGVCDADGAHSPAEKAFLDQLRAALSLDSATTEPINARQLHSPARP